MEPRQELLSLEAFLSNHLSACQYLVEREQREAGPPGGPQREIEARQAALRPEAGVRHLVVVWPENFMMYDVTGGDAVSQERALQLLWQRLDEQKNLRYPEVEATEDGREVMV